MPLTSVIEVLPAWEAAAARILQTTGLTLVWGGTDRGKSTFCRYVLAQAQEQGVSLAFVDSDLGQGHFGPPAVLTLKLFPPSRGRVDQGHPEALYFIGQTSPPGAMLEIILGLRRLVGQARRQGRRRILVNTSGFVQGPLAQRLKLAKVEALRPDLIVALAQDQELEPLLRPVRRGELAEVLILPVSSQARRKTIDERRRNREARFAAYFAGSTPYSLPVADYGWLGFPFGQGEPLSLDRMQELRSLLPVPVLYGEQTAAAALLLLDGSSPRLAEAPCRELLGVEGIWWSHWPSLLYRLVGLLDRRLNTLALGIIRSATWQPPVVTILSPLAAGLWSRVVACRLGRLRLTPAGRELRREETAPGV